ncbi:nucleotidyltransferase domain-containing protein [Arvimicrobium flavum]|uniref:nucleotidyltransferase domain-containing protein n=1 Tax=Arvimicrobium flavum TaxID=3393320 RepID=UPI00237BE1E4|nr:nucleotidyltransferase domain-containing protein [Mesorhizobium shangrilense]
MRSGTEYLLRDYYDPRSGVRRQKSLGRRDTTTEQTFHAFTQGKTEAAERRRAAVETLQRQAAVNRALRLGRVPEIGARIVRALDEAGLLGHGIKIVGTNALFAYEAVAGVHFASELMTTEDIDMLFDARARIRLAMNENVEERTLLGVLRKVDKSFARTSRTFQAANAGGYLVDLIKPERNPPWTVEAKSISGDQSDLEASPIGGLVWHESAQPFEAVAIDARGFPLRLVVPDPRAFAVHKLWLSEQPDRNPAKRRRDRQQAEMVAQVTARYLQHLPFETTALKSFPRAIVERAKPLFEAAPREIV